MENKVFMPPPPKNLRNMPPPPPRPNAEGKGVAQNKTENLQSNGVQAGAMQGNSSVSEKTSFQGGEAANQSRPSSATQKNQKKAGGSKALYWGGFFLCLAAMAAAIYLLITL